jgi:hypothetical protein
VWKPLFALRYSSLSGDRPDTTRWEGFDPLYFSGSDPNWYQGQIGSSIFNNTNLHTASASVVLIPDDKNIVEFRYLHFTADQVNSPLTIPAAVTLPTGGGGVPNKALASEFDISYTYIFSKNANMNAFAAYASPLAGYRELYASYGGSASGWWFLGTQLNISY